MSGDRSKELYKELKSNLTRREFLTRMGFSRTRMNELLRVHEWNRLCIMLTADAEIDCGDILEIARPTLESMGREPEAGWLQYLFDRILVFLYPGAEVSDDEKDLHAGGLFLCEVMHTVLCFNSKRRPFSPVRDFAMLDKEEADTFQIGEEYQRMMQLIRDHYLYEFMKIGAEISPYNTLGHVAGVHFVAMHVARQMQVRDVPVDLAMVSAAAAAHDVGKFGCRKSEASRIPHLHYYYTDECLRRMGLPAVAHIASNHSTWDLELENLSVESLSLIYADFRVKSSRGSDGAEIIHFYSLEEAFDVILNKLENVDEAKKNRYKRVYAKLADFENYMKSLGVSVDLDNDEGSEKQWKDRALLNSAQVVQRLKYLAIEHNIKVMARFSDPLRFGNLLEDARSEKQWKNIRAYLNTIEEYYTYMTPEQKQMTISFLQEQLVNREGDIRRQAASIIGGIIARYDETNRKELPEGVDPVRAETDSHQLWGDHLKMILYPDLQRTERQKRWMGYSLKLTLGTLLDRAVSEGGRRSFLLDLLEMLTMRDMDEATCFILLDTLLEVPLTLCGHVELGKMLAFCRRAMERDSLEVRIAVLRLLKYIAVDGRELLTNEQRELMSSLLAKEVADDESVAVLYLKAKTGEALGCCGEDPVRYREQISKMQESTSDIFRENLKVGTPWVIKAVNIEVMLEELRLGKRSEAYYIATHLSNLLKVSERVTVRHRAGDALVAVFDLLSMDQRNEIVIELTKGLEIGEYQFSKYIPAYLGVLIMHIRPEELEEILRELQSLINSGNEKVASVALETLGVMLNNEPAYSRNLHEGDAASGRLRVRMLGMLMQGLADYHEVISQEAFLVVGKNIFGSQELDLREKQQLFGAIHKKMLTLISENREMPLRFFNNAASLNHIYRFISDYEFSYGRLEPEESRKVAFFPGTFDPFSLGHKGIVTAIRDLGFEVYLALDEFSWSKNTQARMYRKRIMTMSCANETGVYIFPDDEPVNIANAADIRHLKELMGGKETYIVVGSDVIANASSYRKEPEPDSIHSLNHVVFRRESSEQGSQTNARYREGLEQISGKVLELTLPTQLEDISSTRIRMNIDQNRDISSLIDPVVQSYIYDNALYLREPMYKEIISAKDLRFRFEKQRGALTGVTITDGAARGLVIARSRVHQVGTAQLFEEFRDTQLTAYIREKALGKILIIKELYADESMVEANAHQLILTETLAEALKYDFTFAVYHPENAGDEDDDFIGTLRRQGFREIEIEGRCTGSYAVDMRNPVTVFQNMATVLKAPFNKNERVGEALRHAHRRLQYALTNLYPDSLILSFDSAVMHHKLIRRITKENGVPAEPLKRRRLGPYMCVPFGKILNGMAVPNTVTKTLHMEKTFSPDLSSFHIKEYPFYATIEDQVRTIRSFDRPVILVDDLLHKGYRMRRLDPLLNENGVEVQKLIVGLLSGRGRDLMTVQGRRVDSVYFVPNLKSWFVESSLYPFIGGDGVERHTGTINDAFTAINFIMPYMMPHFMAKEADNKLIYEFSMVCLENARDIMKTLEEEYQKLFRRKLTLQRLSEAVNSPKLTDVGQCLDFDRAIAASSYVEDDIERLKRLKEML